MSDKIKPHHRDRKVMLYIRQSSPFQVAHNRESQALQYAMRDRLESLGFREIEVIDEDLGRSAAGTVVRSGFERMVAEVCLGKVGAVAAREVSRFARNSREWQQLVEVCRVVDTVLIDQETVYSPRQSNDRLLLGLKGSLNEYELDLLRQRSLEARHEKARRGELLVAAPVGYLKTADQRMEKDPDRRVREAILLLFRKMAELGSVRQTLLWFLEEGVSLPVRRPDGELIWRRPSYGMVYRILTHPAYGGAYAYGKTEHTSRYENGKPRRSSRRRPKEKWLALIPGTHEGYISWQEFERIQKMIAENHWGEDSPGAAKRGAALLAGLLRCHRCGRRLTVRYTGHGHLVLRYCCHRGSLDNGEPKCIAFGGLLVDQAIGDQVLRVVEPGAMEAAVMASEQDTHRQDEVLAALRRDLEAARYAASRAWKQYDAIDPENRLVADELERRWNQALERVRALELRIEEHQGRSRKSEPAALEEFERLAEDLEEVWNAPTTDVRVKKRIVRTLIQEVVADVDSQAGEIALAIHWKGGVHTELRLPRRRRGQSGSHTSGEIVEAVRVLANVGNDQLIAGVLNRNGLRTGRGNRWTRQHVASLRSHHHIPCYCPQRRETEGWMNLTEAANYLGISTRTLRLAVAEGEIEAKHPLTDGPWVFRRQSLATGAASKVVERARNRVRTPAVPTAEQRTFGFSGKSRDGAV
jgi:DNA invertase Pin-like site-specific DNA recombinase